MDLNRFAIDELETGRFYAHHLCLFQKGKVDVDWLFAFIGKCDGHGTFLARKRMGYLNHFIKYHLSPGHQGMNGHRFGKRVLTDDFDGAVVVVGLVTLKTI